MWGDPTLTSYNHLRTGLQPRSLVTVGIASNPNKKIIYLDLETNSNTSYDEVPKLKDDILSYYGLRYRSIYAPETSLGIANWILNNGINSYE